jgi:predicted N-acetyltransferase YhbS
MSAITIENYPYTFGKREDKKLNFRIKSLAKRNKFYEKHIKNIIEPQGYNWRTDSKQIIVAKQKVKKDYKIVGFIIYSTSTLFSNSYDQQSVCADYWLVDKDFRGNGVGKQLWDEMIKTTEDWGLYNIKVLFKEELKPLYSKMGFSYIPTYKGVKQEEVSENGHLKWWKIRQPFVRLSGKMTGDEEDQIITFV